MGYFGPLLRPDGNVSSELGFEFDHGGKQVSAPLIVPTLSREQLDHLLSGDKPTDDIYDTAQQFAIERMMNGHPTWARPNEIYPLPK